MKFFTTELFVALNSQDDDVSDAAAEKWETARRAYREHFGALSASLPRSLVKLCKMVLLHDSSIEHPSDPTWTVYQTDDEGEQSRAIISLRSETAEFDLVYLDLVKPCEQSKLLESDVFHDDYVIWLYDEFDRTEDGAFTHEILFSNGYTVLVTFRGFKFVERPIIGQTLLAKAAV